MKGLFMGVARCKQSPDLKILFLTGAGNMFCTGADPKMFQMAAQMAKEAAAKGTQGGDEDGNASSANQFAEFLNDLHQLKCHTVGLCNGSAMAGGIGLLCCCKHVIAKKQGMFSLSEVKLGVIPAAISPYVVEKMGVSNARRFFMTGETINSAAAVKSLLVDAIVPENSSLELEAKKICEQMGLPAL